MSGPSSTIVGRDPELREVAAFLERLRIRPEARLSSRAPRGSARPRSGRPASGLPRIAATGC